MGYGYLNPPLSPLGQGMLSQNPIGLTMPPKGTPVNKSPAFKIPAGGFLNVLGGALAVNEAIGQAGGYKWRDDLLAKIGNGKGAQVSNPLEQQLTSGITYEVFITYTVKQTGESTPPFGIGSIVAPLQGVQSFEAPNAPNGDPSSSGIIVTGATGAVSFAGNSGFYSNFSLASLRRSDGQTEPPAQPQRTPTNEGYKPPQDGYLASSPSPSAPPATKPPYYNPAFPAAVGAAPSALKNPPSPAPSPKPPSSPAPSAPPLSSPSSPPSPASAPVGKPSPSSFKPDKPQEPEKPPSQANDILGKLAQLIGITALINSNTQPEKQRLNAKEGTCDALQSPQCTKGVEDRIKDPIMDNVDATKAQTVANAGAISSVLSLLATVWDFLQNKIGKVLNILNNSVVDRTLAVMNLATNIHNAAMLSRDIGETLGSVVDNVLSLSGLKFTNSEGSQVQFTDFIGANFRAFMVSVLGAENYVSLVLQWQKANTVYHATMGVINTTQSMLDPISSAVEYGMENVSKIGNSLKEDGVVSENAYPAMDETIRARRVNRFERLNDTLEGAENVASNLSSVTSSAVSVKEDYKQLREDAKDLKDKAAAFNTADSEARAALKAELPTEITPITLAPAPAEDEAP